MRALDPRLLANARATRTFLVVSVALGVIGAVLIVMQAWLLADVVSRAFLGGRSVAQLRTPLSALLAVVLARATVAWIAELAAARSSARAKSQLRSALLQRVAILGQDNSRESRTGELAVLAGRGIDALDGYFSLYLPQLFLAVIVPVFIVVAVLWSDWISAAIIAFTIPLIPLFMALVGATTRERMDAQFRILEQLAGHFLDVVAGLPTLKVFGRAKAQARTIREVTERYRVTAMATLRVTFLSSLILELVAMISVALVAVAIGLRLMDGRLDLRTGLFALVLAPEAYLPLRKLGANYHASAEGIAAADQVFAVLQAPQPPRGTRIDVPDPALAGLEVDGLTVSYPDRSEPALAGVSLSVQAREVVALVGPSGCGKSTLLSALLGFLEPDLGSIRVGDVDLTELDPEAWRAHLAWVPQRPHLFSTSIAQNVRLGRGDASEEDVRAAIEAAGLSDAVARLPDGPDTVLGERGAGLSAGERQRVALARAFLRDAPLLLLDEPTANLDGETEREVVQAIRRLSAGRTVLLVAHRPALIEMADRAVSLAPVEVAA
ncbi:MAG TPA: thiol reductant ABC exporter subunit CydD [Solirubrobacteraceae bacterium]|nr:thiol reductant ABC exporter subunit CydD [Solirubrobacteraceae bacterium]